MDAEGQILGYWTCNDAKWRNEYFNGVFDKIGVTIERGSDEQNAHFVQAMVKSLGF